MAKPLNASAGDLNETARCLCEIVGRPVGTIGRTGGMMPFPSHVALVGLAAAGLAVALVLRARRSARAAESLAALRASWGHATHQRRDFDTSRRFVALTEGETARAAMDEHTWLDLDMDEVYASIDRTRSSPGQLVLYRWLRGPAPDPRTLERRDRTIRLFQQDPRAREAVQLALGRLGLSSHVAEVVSLLWDREAPDVPPWRTLSVMAALAVLATLSPLFLGGAGWLLLITTFGVNYVLHARTQIRFGPEILGLRHLAATLATAGELVRTRIPGLEEHAATLAEHHRAARPVARSIALFPAGRPADLVYEYLNILFLLEARGLARALGAIRDPALRGAFLAVGELDAAQAAASFRDGLPYSCAPVFSDGSVALEIEDVYHPLLEAPVPNSISLQDHGTLITGCNMSGKSTFLRALGINAILAQAIHTCTARRYHAGRLRVLSSMRSTDDLVEGKSAYWAEAERLLAIIRAMETPEPVLCLIDEILAGTNSAERRAASVEILQFLSRRRALLVATTHDVELTTALGHALDCYHFSGEAFADGIRFGYQLRPGVARTGNAIQLLGILGFPPDIVEGARRRVTAGEAAG